MDLDPLGLAAGVAGLMALAAALWKGDRGRRQERLARLEGMGFQRGLPPGMLTLEPVQGLLRPPEHGRPPQVRQVWHKVGDDFVLLLLEFVEPRGTGPVVAIRSPRLQVPRFSLFPKVDQEGMLADLANRALALLLEHVGGQVAFTSPGEFVRRYLVAGPDEQAVRDYLTEERRRQLGETRSWSLQAEGDLFVLDELPIATRGKAPAAGAEDARIRDAMAALRILQSQD